MIDGVKAGDKDLKDSSRRLCRVCVGCRDLGRECSAWMPSLIKEEGSIQREVLGADSVRAVIVGDSHSHGGLQRSHGVYQATRIRLSDIIKQRGSQLCALSSLTPAEPVIENRLSQTQTERWLNLSRHPPLIPINGVVGAVWVGVYSSHKHTRWHWQTTAQRQEQCAGRDTNAEGGRRKRMLPLSPE
jgi:hypothetical protein